MSTGPGGVLFKLQIVDNNGVVATFPAGGILERSIVEAFASAIESRLGMWNTRAKPYDAVKDGVTEVVTGLKQETVRIL